MTHSKLWPDHLDDQDAPDMAPKTVLEFAAKELSTRTHGQVEGEIHTRGTGDRLEHSFYLRSTDVDYRYLLFKVRHGIHDFPVEIVYPEKLTPSEYPDRTSFEGALRELFKQRTTLDLVARLRTLAREVG